MKLSKKKTKKQFTTWQIANLKKKKHIKPVKVVNFNSSATNFNVLVFIIMQSWHTVCALYATKVTRFVDK